jgi:hypothetical protein
MTGFEKQLASFGDLLDERYGPVSDSEVAAAEPVRHRRVTGVFAFGLAAAVVLVLGLATTLLMSGSTPVATAPTPVATAPTPVVTDPAPVVTDPAPTLHTTTSVGALPLTPQNDPFTVEGSVDGEWMKLAGVVPYGIDAYESGEYFTRSEYTTGAGYSEYRSDDGITWTLETNSTTLLPEWVSDNGTWGYITDGMFTGILLTNTDGQWETVPRPPQADQSGAWEWQTRMLAVSGDILLIVGGPSHEDSSLWRVDGGGSWDLVEPVDYGRTYRAVPAGGFVYYDETTDTIHTSADGLQWTDGVKTDHPYWESGNEIFPGRIYSEKAGQIWTSADAITWIYEFTRPPGGEYGWHLNRTNHGIVATRLTGSETNTKMESWLLAEDRQTWSALTPVSIGAISFGAANHGAAGDLVWLSVTGDGEEPTLTPQNMMWTAQLPNE